MRLHNMYRIGYSLSSETSKGYPIQAAQDGCYGWGILLRFLMKIKHEETKRAKVSL
jgi:hypothetical protein